MATILLLESDRSLAKSTSAYLERCGHRVLWFSQPQAAITAADKAELELIIISLSLASRSGIEFLYELRSYPDWQDVPVIVTGQLDPSEQESYSQAFSQLNVTQYLPKENLELSELAAAAGRLQPASR